MPTHSAPRIRAARVLLAVLMLGSAVAANPPVPSLPAPSLPGPCPPPCPSPIPCPPRHVPCPPPAPACAPCQTGTAAQPRIVVNVPPPEIVYQDMPAQASCKTPSLFPRCNLFHRSSCGAPMQMPAQMPAQTVSFAPLQQQTVTGSSLAVFGSAGLNFASANPAPPMVAVAPTFVAQPVVQQVQVQQTQSAVSSGLTAIHQAELYAASVASTRAQQDAELRVMMSALDRARGSMLASTSAGLSSPSGACPELSCESMKALIAATTASSQQIGVLATKMDKLQQRLDALTQQVDTLTKNQELIVDKVFPTPTTPMVPPKK